VSEHPIAPGFTATITPVAAVDVPLAELQALRATMRELLALTDALHAAPGASMHVEALQGLARAVARRLERLG
jgi:hypothetical protein